MASIGTGYDLSTTTFSPIGRLFQIEYAHKAIDSSGTAIGLRCSDGVVLACEKIITSKLLEPGTGRRVQGIAPHVGMVTSGWVPDSLAIATKARNEAQTYKEFYDDAIPLKTLNDRVSNVVQMHTIYGHIRPFGVATILGGIDRSGPQLYMVEPSGLSWGYFGCAAGKAAAAARTQIEKLDLKNLKCKDAVVEAAKIIYAVHDEIKDKMFELEMCWVCPESGNKYQLVPKDILSAAEKVAKEAEEEDSDSDVSM
eukprot:TRINITY_DN16762_c0_g1_i1.p1 TRINITY_DN16762_c0_g1~~TRINITY_DN16762_c0_g1_i1.p1  ORF type:complete len:254 (+),score=56.70 TRINITY_DN16762_c0_g1_i1:41-802(+)